MKSFKLLDMSIQLKMHKANIYLKQKNNLDFTVICQCKTSFFCLLYDYTCQSLKHLFGYSKFLINQKIERKKVDICISYLKLEK